MQNVYVLTSINIVSNNETQIIGVYQSLDRAQAYQDQLRNDVDYDLYEFEIHTYPLQP